MEVQEVPIPQVGPKSVLVQNYYSIISPGTEGSTVSTARKGLLAKAKERPQQVKQVIDTLKTQGPVKTYRAVSKKLDAYSPLGYSCSGKVLAIGTDVDEFKVGDLVACAGAGYANHAEVVSVPVNLCVKVASAGRMREAAYNTLGAIALQGIRQADLKLGESCLVLGLELLGHLTGHLLKASGVRVIGVDISSSSVEFAHTNNAVEHAFNRDEPGIEDKIQELTQGHGVDAVIIAAATNSLDPINFSGAIVRKKGRVVILGAVPSGFERDPFWYKKELELKMACSYGPGRYDPSYEEKGIDYPYPYVRWTENRNMQAFQDLLEKGSLKIEYLTTHEFSFDKAPDAYNLILEKSENFSGIALRYRKEKLQESAAIQTGQFKPHDVNISFIGAGSYAQGSLLPNLPSTIGRVCVLTNSGTTSKRVAERFSFSESSSREADVFDERTNTVFIATRHDSHGDYVEKSLSLGKHVFVEKPLCLNQEQLTRIIEKSQQARRGVMVGFNRRFSPLAVEVKKKFGSGKMSMTYRINAGKIPAESWVHDAELGGGRVIGEVCHFIDFLTFINGSVPTNISAMAMEDNQNLQDCVNLSMTFKNGSVGVISYLANGSKSVAKERIEIHSSGKTAIIEDFKELKVFGKGKVTRKRLLNQDKGQKAMVSEFISSIETAGKVPIPIHETITTTKATFRAMESIKNGGKLLSID